MNASEILSLFLESVGAAGSEPPYRIGLLVGRGASGVVYLAERVQDGARVALKIVVDHADLDPRSRQRLEREVTVLRDLCHPNIVRLLDGGSFGRCVFLALEFCDGGNASALVQDGRRPLAPARAIRLALDVARGLAYAHDRQIVHRDIKPANIVLTQNGEAKLTDFGLAKNTLTGGLSGLTATGEVEGTYEFMPPEQVTQFRKLRPTADVWALAATLYFLLTGRYTRDRCGDIHPLESTHTGRIVPIRERDSSVPEALAAIVDRAIARDPASRYQTAGELYAALAGLA